MFPTSFDSEDLTAENIVHQNLHHICLYESLKVEAKSLWFDYMESVFDRCITVDGNDTITEPISDDCIDHLIERQSGHGTNASQTEEAQAVNWDRYDQCMANQQKAIDATGSKEENRIGKSYMKGDQELLEG